MGEGKRRRQTLTERLKAEPRCIYCAGPNETEEHMPPRIMFLRKDRPQGMEFAACEACNGGTSGADAVAAFMAKMRIHEDGTGRHLQENLSLKGTIEQKAPGVLEELFDRDDKISNTLVRSPGGILVPSVKVMADGPLLKAYLQAFAAKLAMALYREHIGEALPLDGYVGTAHFLNAGLAAENAERMLQTLPVFDTLKQGRKDAGAQFGYRYNTDEKSIIAALVRFHEGLFVFLVASSESRARNLNPDNVNWRMSQPGGVLAMLPSPTGPARTRSGA